MKGDLKSPRIIVIKGILFVLMGMIAAGLLWAQMPDLTNLFLLGVVIWGFSRAYYFAFYVLEKYVDPKFRYRGLIHLISQLRKR